MSDNKITTPSSSAGLVRFYDINASNIQLEPQLIVGIAIAIIVLEIALKIIK